MPYYHFHINTAQLNTSRHNYRLFRSSAFLTISTNGSPVCPVQPIRDETRNGSKLIARHRHWSLTFTNKSQNTPDSRRNVCHSKSLIFEELVGRSFRKNLVLRVGPWDPMEGQDHDRGAEVATSPEGEREKVERGERGGRERGVGVETVGGRGGRGVERGLQLGGRRGGGMRGTV